MSQPIEGTCKNESIRLDRLPGGVTEARVKVEFMEQAALTPHKSQRGLSYFGMFALADGQYTSDDDLERPTSTTAASSLPPRS